MSFSFGSFCRFGVRFAIFSMMILGFCCGPAAAATFTVTNTNDSGAGSLRQAIDDANDGDIINFDLAPYPKTITVSTTLLTFDSITINGPGSDKLMVRMTGADSVFKLNGGVDSIDVTIKGLRISGGNATSGGGIYSVYTHLLLDGCLVCENRASGGGGVAIYGDGSELTAVDTEISGNTAYGANGGGINFFGDGALSLERVVVTDNFCEFYGGGVYMASPGTVTIKDSFITENNADKFGGGVYWGINDGDGKLVMTDCEISGNTVSESSGGGLHISGPEIEMTRCLISANKADGYGGGLYARPTSPGAVTLHQCRFQGNTSRAFSGGGANIGGAALVSECLFENNQVLENNHGGGLDCASTSGATILNTVFRGNAAADDGGGAYCRGSINISGCLFEDNHCGSRGGGIALSSNAMTIKNSTFHANKADGAGGGGIACKQYVPGSSPAEGSQVDLSFVTITGNIGDYDCTDQDGTGCESDPGGGIYLSDDSVTHTVTLKSCVVAGNKISQRIGPILSLFYGDLSAGTFTSAGYNYIGLKGAKTFGFTDGVNNDQVGGGISNARLMDLADNGGLTNTRMPMPDSPLVNAGGAATDVSGNPVATDQRGKRRPVGSACDIGAVETENGASLTPIYLLLFD